MQMIDKEKECVAISIAYAVKAFGQENYSDSITHLQNAIRSLNELKQDKNERDMYERAVKMISQLSDENKGRLFD
ncbi:MAG TPA: hypothetical protein VK093_00110 [Candidatus Avipropionibacterium sp.]|nr:hypothetical protein [Candidatus Avipropionibacterium sp.]